MDQTPKTVVSIFLEPPSWFDGSVIAFIITVFVLYAILSIKERHRDAMQSSILIGAAIYGLITGAVIAFLILPMRGVIMSSDAPPQVAALGGIAVFLTMFSLRRGLVGRLPFLGRHLRAYRRAQLRKTVEIAQAQLDHLETS